MASRQLPEVVRMNGGRTPEGGGGARDLPDVMRAWRVTSPGPVAGGGDPPLELVEVPLPSPLPGELLVRVEACGVCRTDLHVAEGDLPVHRHRVVPGHEVVGRVVGDGGGVHGGALDGWSTGDRVGIAWLRHTCGRCRWCVRGAENLCPYGRFTGWDADGGYAEFATVPAAFAYRLPDDVAAVSLAPLLCAGIIGYRALRRAALPEGGRLGLYGFGGSAHLCAQVAIAAGATVHVLTRDAAAQRLALDLGAASAGGAYDAPPEPLDAAVLFAPVGDLVPVALRALDRGGVLAVAGIHLSDTPPLVYESELFYEKELRSVTANTRDDGRVFLDLAVRHGVRATTHPYPLEEGLSALRDLKAGRFDGAAVLVP
ncbi:zinc-binding alcohol dehydrogenase family protein [Mumia sp.]|uniref:zinc-binding alcohol dehydrogenase family protein n=1 Tax=Mumia sp. TaxID=1965300 RepID=UPI0026265ADB|nr:zinc-binding alcohol dehydrogenase family protein [Mumia sp.]MDD9349080.1 zinc-binding alcohol dehydrogenase family protein [Mumia sp.]